MNDYRKDQATIYRLRNKYHDVLVFDLIERSACRIANFIKRHYLKSVVNMSEDVLMLIPGIFRLRLKFTDKNREQVEEKIEPVKIKEPVKKPKTIKPIVNKYNEDIDKALEMSMKEVDDNDVTHARHMSLQNDDTDTELYIAIMNSLNLCSEELEEKEEKIEEEPEEKIEEEPEEKIEEEPEEKIEEEHDYSSDEEYDYSSDEEYDYSSDEEYKYPGEKYVYNEELSESFSNDSNKEDIFKSLEKDSNKDDIFEHISSDVSEEEVSEEETSEIISSDSEDQKEGFYVCVDLRYYARSLNQPVYVHGEPFYLRPKQQKQIKKLWKRIDPETDNGIIYSQNRDIEKAMVTDFFK